MQTPRITRKKTCAHSFYYSSTFVHHAESIQTYAYTWILTHTACVCVSVAEGNPSAPVAVVTGRRLVLRGAPGLRLPCGAPKLARHVRLSPRPSVPASSATHAPQSRTRAFLAALPGSSREHNTLCDNFHGG